MSWSADPPQWLEVLPRLPFNPSSQVLRSRRIELDLLAYSEAVVNDLFQCGPTDPHMVENETDSSKLPRLKVFMYIICYHARLSKMAFTTALFYLLRLKRFQPLCRGVYGSGHRLFLAAIIIATKYLYDDPYDNRSWVNVLNSRFDLAEVNQMEMELLQHLKYMLYIRPDEYVEFLRHADNELVHREIMAQPFYRCDATMNSPVSSHGGSNGLFQVPVAIPSPSMAQPGASIASSGGTCSSMGSFHRPPLSPPETDADSLSVCSSQTDMSSILSSSGELQQPCLSTSSSTESLRVGTTFQTSIHAMNNMPITPQENVIPSESALPHACSTSSLPYVNSAVRPRVSHSSPPAPRYSSAPFPVTAGTRSLSHPSSIRSSYHSSGVTVSLPPVMPSSTRSVVSMGVSQSSSCGDVCGKAYNYGYVPYGARAASISNTGSDVLASFNNHHSHHHQVANSHGKYGFAAVAADAASNRSSQESYQSSLSDRRAPYPEGISSALINRYAI